jgi:hypothetical protein
MSALPKNVGIPHRRAIRNYVAKLNLEESMTDKENNVSQEQLSRSKKTKTNKTVGMRRAPVEKPGQGLKQSDIVAFNHSAEGAFVTLITGLLTDDGKLSYREAIREAAYELGVSIETAKRYLEKHSARRAEFCCEDGSVKLRRS